jgi:hypothetical protein
MISIQLDKFTFNNFINELNYKLDGLREITTPNSRTEIAKSVFTISSNDFVKNFNRKAKTNRNLSHVYEWNGAGMNTARLFMLQRKSVQYGNLVIATKFKNSKVPVPVNKNLLTPGKTGKRVVSRNIFIKKAEVMESGQPVTIRAKKPLPFWDGKEIKFIPKNTSVIVRNPGGVGKRNAYEKEFLQWFTSGLGQSVSKSNLIPDLERSIIQCLNTNKASREDVKKTISRISGKYSKNKVIV